MQRAKHLKNGYWVYGELCHLNLRPYISTGNIFVPVIPGTAGRDTGMRDLQHDPIFEGDIREVNGKRYVVAYSDDDASFVAKWKDREGNEGEEFLSDMPLGVKIGDIVNNPELMEWEQESDWHRAYRLVSI